VSRVRSLLLRAYNSLRPDPAARDLTRELTAHLEMLQDVFERQGMSVEEARVAARRAFGGVAQVTERHRDTRSFRWLDDLRRDIAYGCRGMLGRPWFAIVAVVTLALGIGANTAIFSVVHAVLLRPLPYPESDRLVQFLFVNESGAAPNASVPKFAIWRELSDVFEHVAGYNPRGPAFSLTGGPQPQQIRGFPVTADYFTLFGARMAQGRSFTADEDRPGGPPVAVLSHGLWQRQYGGAPDIVGRAIEIDGVLRTVVGVVDSSFAADPPPDVWIPYQFDLSSLD
jgi:putative ABC transport system permease protein